MDGNTFFSKVFWLTIFILFIFFAPLFSSIETFDTAVKDYIKMLKEYEGDLQPSELVEDLKRELKLLPVYRLFKLAVVGSVERKERATDITDLLTVFYYKRKPKETEKKLSLALLLAYVSADVSNRHLDESLINKLPAFISAYKDYSVSVVREAISFLKHAIAYLIGLVDSPPEGFNGGRVGRLDLSANFDYLVYKKGKYHKDILDMIMNSELKDEVFRKAREIIEEKPDEKKVKIMITRASASLSREIRSILSKRQGELVKMVMEKSPRRYDLWWLRILIYASLIVLAFKLKNPTFWKYSIYSILIFEFLYVSFISKGFFGLFDSVFYTFMGFFLFIFSVLKFSTLLRDGKVKTLSGKIGLFTMMMVVVILLVVPIYRNSNGLRITNLGDLDKSIYYEQLKEDVYEGQDSELRKLIVSISSLSAKEQNDLKNLVRKTGNAFSNFMLQSAVKDVRISNGKLNFRIPTFSEFYSISNRENYSEEVESLRKTFDNFILDSNARCREIERSMNKLFKISRRYYELSNEKMRKDFKEYMVKSFGRSKITKFMVDEMNTLFDQLEDEPVRAITIRPYRTYHGIRAILILMMLFSTVVIFRDDILRRILSIFPILLSLMWIIRIKSPLIFVEWKVPYLSCKIHDGIIYPVPILVMAISIFIFLCGKIFEKGVEG